MIRKDTTNYNQNTDPNNWANSMYTENEMEEREVRKQETLQQNWKNIFQSGDKARIAEAELARRISAATEGDTISARVDDAIKGAKVSAAYDEELEKMRTQGQSIDDFLEEQRAYGQQHIRAMKKAIESVK